MSTYVMTNSNGCEKMCYELKIHVSIKNIIKRERAQHLSF